MQDARQLPVAEGDVVVEVGDVAAGPLGVEIPHLRPRAKARPGRRRHPAEHRGGVARFGPVDHQESKIGERVTEGAQLPVEHGRDRSVTGEHRVVESAVAVHDGGAVLGRDRCGEALVDPVDGADADSSVDLGSIELCVPAIELASEVALAAAEITETGGVYVKGV